MWYSKVVKFVPANLFLYFFLVTLSVGGFFLATIWPEPKGFYAFILLAGVGGFGVASYIRYTKQHHAELVCPVGSDCNAVVNSRYSIFLGVHLEYWGMLYYALILFAYGTILFAPHLFTKTFLSALVLFSTFGFFFSLYLIVVQAFVLRQWCIWCLLSATLSIAIFIASLVSVPEAMMLLSGAAVAISVIHSLGFIFGMGGATAMIFLFGKCLRDLKIDDSELTALKGLSELIWFGIALTLASQIAHYVANAGTLSSSGPFITQTVALFATAMASAVVMIIFEPVLSMIPFEETPRGKKHSLFRPLRKPLFVTLAIMLSSWYVAFAMSYLHISNIVQALSIYISVLILSIATSLLIELKLRRIPVKRVSVPKISKIPKTPKAVELEV